MIGDKCGTLKWKKKIVITTNGTGLMDTEDLDGIRDKINQEGIELVILYVPMVRPAKPRLNAYRGADFDDLDYGFKEEDKEEQKVRLLRSVLCPY